MATMVVVCCVCQKEIERETSTPLKRDMTEIGGPCAKCLVSLRHEVNGRIFGPGPDSAPAAAR